MIPEYRYISKGLQWATMVVAGLYALMFAVKLLLSYTAWRSAGAAAVEWTVTDDPQSFIVFCLIAAALSLRCLRDVGKMVALVLFATIIGKFFFWYSSTRQIKFNTGLEAIPRAGWIGNVWLGAGVPELITLFVTIGLIAADLWLLLRRPKNRLDQAEGIELLHS